MNKPGIKESSLLLSGAMNTLLAEVPSTGREASDMRRAAGDLIAHAPLLLRNDEAGEPTANSFDVARLAGVTAVGFAKVIQNALAQQPLTPGGSLTKNCVIEYALATACRVLVDTTFDSRQDVDRMIASVNDVFAYCEETSADAMDSETYRVLVKLHGAITFHLTATGRMLPRLIRFGFARPLPTLAAAYKLYDDAARGEDMRAENKVVHPAFMQPYGVALSA